MKNILGIAVLAAAVMGLGFARPALADETLSLAPDPAAQQISATGPVSTVLVVNDSHVGNDEAAVAGYLLGSQATDQEDD